MAFRVGRMGVRLLVLLIQAPPPASRNITNFPKSIVAPQLNHAVDPSADLTRCFLRLANLHNYALDRLSRYEATLWRQVSRILFALNALDRRKPQERGRHFRVGSQH